MQNRGQDADRSLIEETANIAATEGIQLVAANNVLFLDPDDAEVYNAHILFTANDADKKVKKFLQKKRTYDQVKEQYFKNNDEMAVLFSSYPDAIGNTLRIAERCQKEVVKYQGSPLPDASIPSRFHNADDYLRQLVMKGIEDRYHENRKAALERAEYELTLVKEKHYADLYLIVADCIKITKEQNISVGLGRGAITNSIIAYALGITGIDPLKYDLFFEHFISSEKDGAGNFRLNIADNSSGKKIVDYIDKKYPGRVISKFPTHAITMMAESQLLKQLVKTFYEDESKRNELLKILSDAEGFWGSSIVEILTNEQVFREFSINANFRKLVSIARKFPEAISGFQLHDDLGEAIGIFILLRDSSLIPLYAYPGKTGAQYDLDDLKHLGFISYNVFFSDPYSHYKYSHIVDAINKIRHQHPQFNINNIPEDDCDTLEQLMEDRSCLSDLIPIYAIYEMQSEDCTEHMRNCIQKKKRIVYPHKCLKDILKDTYGIIAYNEQIIKIIAKITGYSLGKSDLVFTILKEKNHFPIEREKEKFIAAAKTKGFSRGKAEHIFDTLRSFAPLTSGKGDIIAKAVLAYQAAYIEVHFPETEVPEGR
jgi:DNA polymerase-3 subunit alpha